MRIGVFDSGLGGLTVLRELLRTFPGADYYYLGDTARAPYGSKSPQTISRYARECQAFLEHRGIDLLVVACNTASSLALSDLQKSASYPVIGTIGPAVKAALSQGINGKVGVIGTRATIQSQVYERALKAENPNVSVFSVACPLFVPLVEEGIFEGPLVEEAMRHYLRSLQNEGVRSLILGCTHYPLLTPVLSEFFRGKTEIIECSKAIAEEIAQRFPEAQITGREGKVEFFVTDEVSRFNALAGTLLEGISVQAVSLEDLSC